jgi:hypothetical protein
MKRGKNVQEVEGPNICRKEVKVEREERKEVKGYRRK